MKVKPFDIGIRIRRGTRTAPKSRSLWSVVLVLGMCVAHLWASEGAPPAKDVAIQVVLIDVLVIDSAAQTVLIDFAIRTRWVDHALAAEGEPLRLIHIDEAWNPEFQVIGDMGLRKKASDVLEVHPDGAVEYRQRFAGMLTARMDLSDFPLDRHIIEIRVIAVNQEEVAFRAEVESSGQSEILTAAEWQINQGRLYEDQYHIMDDEFASVVYAFEVERHVGYYVWKVMVPLLLIVFMSWVVFWIDPANFGPQIGAATASMLTLISYRFALDRLVPKISYFTRMDWFITGSTMLVFLALIQAIWTSRIMTQEKQHAASKADRICRWLFPAMFVLVLLRAFVL